jgi:hypothetical protein
MQPIHLPALGARYWTEAAKRIEFLQREINLANSF